MRRGAPQPKRKNSVAARGRIARVGGLAWLLVLIWGYIQENRVLARWSAGCSAECAQHQAGLRRLFLGGWA